MLFGGIYRRICASGSQYRVILKQLTRSNRLFFLRFVRVPYSYNASVLGIVNYAAKPGILLWSPDASDNLVKV